jgi:hypothetical protein
VTVVVVEPIWDCAVASLEEAVLAANGVVLRYDLFYGPGTYFERELPATPHVSTLPPLGPLKPSMPPRGF